MMFQAARCPHCAEIIAIRDLQIDGEIDGDADFTLEDDEPMTWMCPACCYSFSPAEWTDNVFAVNFEDEKMVVQKELF